MELYLYPDEIIGEKELKEIRSYIVRRGKENLFNISLET